MSRILRTVIVSLVLAGPGLVPSAQAQWNQKPHPGWNRPANKEMGAEQKNEWVRRILGSVWAGILGGLTLFGLATTFCLFIYWRKHVHRIREPWESAPPPKPF